MKSQFWGRVMRMLRTVGSAFCTMLCVGFAILWCRSYFLYDVLNAKPANYGIFVNSWRGALQVSCEYGQIQNCVWMTENAEMFRQEHGDSLPIDEVAELRALPFNVSHLDGNLRATFPHWFMVLTIGTLACGLKAPPRRRFSTREIFVFLTVAAGVLAALGALPHRI